MSARISAPNQREFSQYTQGPAPGTMAASSTYRDAPTCYEQSLNTSSPQQTVYWRLLPHEFQESLGPGSSCWGSRIRRSGMCGQIAELPPSGWGGSSWGLTGKSRGQFPHKSDSSTCKRLQGQPPVWRVKTASIQTISDRKPRPPPLPQPIEPPQKHDQLSTRGLSAACHPGKHL